MACINNPVTNIFSKSLKMQGPAQMLLVTMTAVLEVPYPVFGRVVS